MNHRLSLLLLANIAWCSLHAQVIFGPGVGWEGQGAGIRFAQLDSDPRLDVVLMAYDNPPQANTFRYVIGWNVNTAGQPTSWSTTKIVGGVGWEAQGAGIAIGNLDSNPRPEFICMAYDNPSGANTYRYRIGWNVNTSGDASWWDNGVVVGGSGWDAQGADIDMVNLDSNPRPELLVMAYDSPSGANNFRIRIGWNLSTSGIAASWTSLAQLPGVGWDAEGAGMAIGNLGGTSRPDIVLMANDGMPNQPKTIRARIGWDLDNSGNATSWTNQPIVPGLGWSAHGAGVAVANVTGGSVPNIVYMAYDAPPGNNNFRYIVDPGPRVNVLLEMDRTADVNWVPATVNRLGNNHTLPGIFNQATVNLNAVNDDVVPDLGNQVYTDAELNAFLTANRNLTPAPGQWHVHGALVPFYIDVGVYGIMYDTGQRRGFASFDSEIPTDAEYMRTTAHELGHALNLEHDDGDAYQYWSGWWIFGSWKWSNGRTIMNQTARLRSDWDYIWNVDSLAHYMGHDLGRWEPTTGLAFGNCH